MANRIEQKFAALKEENKAAFIAYVTAGDPSLKTTEALVPALEKAGTDIIELGVPFSDPLADGPTIQAAMQRSLANGTTLTDVLKLVKRLRDKTEIPIALMMYYNQIYRYGDAKFVKAAKKAGVDGLIVPDLPPEEAEVFIQAARRYDMSTIFFIAPTTTEERMRRIIKASTGFIYYVSVAGVTGARKTVSSSYLRQLKTARQLTDKPVCIGFGVSTPAQVKSLGKVANGVIVGSAIINQLSHAGSVSARVQRTARFVRSLTKVL